MLSRGSRMLLEDISFYRYFLTLASERGHCFYLDNQFVCVVVTALYLCHVQDFGFGGLPWGPLLPFSAGFPLFGWWGYVVWKGREERLDAGGPDENISRLGPKTDSFQMRAMTKFDQLSF